MYTMYCICRSRLLMGEKVSPLTNFSFKPCFTAGNGGEIAAEVFCCPLFPPNSPAGNLTYQHSTHNLSVLSSF